MFKDEYQQTFRQVTASQQTHRRIMNMSKKQVRQPKRGFVRKALMTAAITSMLVIGVSAAEYVYDIFSAYFQSSGGQALTDSQVSYIQENIQKPTEIVEEPISQTSDGYTFTLKDILTDGRVAYVTMHIEGPEDVCLDESDLEGCTEAPDIYSLDRLKPIKADGVELTADGNLTGWHGGQAVVEDNDGKDNTIDLVSILIPEMADHNALPFAEGNIWQIEYFTLEALYYNDTYRAQIAEQYEGQALLPDDVGQTLHPRKLLSEDGVWSFTLEFGPADMSSVELVTEPISVKASNMLYDDYTIDCDLVSLQLSALGYQFVLEPHGTDLTGKQIDAGWFSLVMKDGTEDRMIATTGIQEFASPIILEEVDYVRCPDGTRLYLPQD